MNYPPHSVIATALQVTSEITAIGAPIVVVVIAGTCQQSAPTTCAVVVPHWPRLEYPYIHHIHLL